MRAGRSTLVPNPDLIYPGGGGFGFAAGTIANMFEGALRFGIRIGRTALRAFGKPNTPIFEDAIRRSARRARSWSATRSNRHRRGAPPASTRCRSRWSPPH
jgi:ribonucleotide monophosphatase NagD (HAD superfamily)